MPNANETGTLETVGYLSISKLEPVGYCGGFLLLNATGRPVEFHCTLPINPDRSQEILFGAALLPVLFVDCIGRPLTQKASRPPELILVDDDLLLGLQKGLECPVIHLNESLTVAAGMGQATLDGAPSGVPDRDLSPLVGSPLADSRLVQRPTPEIVSRLAERVELAEPFERIREALQEAHGAQAA